MSMFRILSGVAAMIAVAPVSVHAISSSSPSCFSFFRNNVGFGRNNITGTKFKLFKRRPAAPSYKIGEEVSFKKGDLKFSGKISYKPWRYNPFGRYEIKLKNSSGTSYRVRPRDISKLENQGHCVSKDTGKSDPSDFKETTITSNIKPEAEEKNATTTATTKTEQENQGDDGKSNDSDSKKTTATQNTALETRAAAAEETNATTTATTFIDLKTEPETNQGHDVSNTTGKSDLSDSKKTTATQQATQTAAKETKTTTTTTTTGTGTGAGAGNTTTSVAPADPAKQRRVYKVYTEMTTDQARQKLRDVLQQEFEDNSKAKDEQCATHQLYKDFKEHVKANPIGQSPKLSTRKSSPMVQLRREQKKQQ